MTSPTDVLSDTRTRMTNSVDALKRDLAVIRTGRASPGLVESLMIDYYGVPTPLNQLASISVPEARSLMVQPWDKQSLKEVEKSIMKSDLGLMPNNDGNAIRINIPPLTEERRRELVRVVSRKVEDGHVAVRNVRRDSLETFRGLERSGDLSQDESRRAQNDLQQVTDSFIEQMDQLKREKEAEVMEV
ncbi:MAG: ribosome recycling factor [SAR202 cluster bacterium]|nr:ribosome recycling factor [SAR202 cluster bacterium]MDP7102993.1 ribosome recycling factor [SAR202 cluster bacterium]MDP7225423.1 ribosome recycling factor [SAR202 cluster bacterium]